MRFILSFIVLAFALTACSSDPSPEVGTAGELVEWDNHCSEVSDGQRLALEGYFVLGAVFIEERDGTASLIFQRDLERDIVNFIRVFIPIGESAGQVKAPPSSYGMEDLEFRSSVGEVLGHEDAIRLSFTLKFIGNRAGLATCTYEAPFLIESLTEASSEAATEESE